MANDTAGELTYTVPGMSCDHCRTAITEEVARVDGVAAVDVELDAKLVTVRGARLDDEELRVTIEQAGYEVGR